MRQMVLDLNALLRDFIVDFRLSRVMVGFEISIVEAVATYVCLWRSAAMDCAIGVELEPSMENLCGKNIYSVVEEMNLFLLTPIGVSGDIFTYKACNAFMFIGNVGNNASNGDGGYLMRMEKFFVGNGNLFLVVFGVDAFHVDC